MRTIKGHEAIEMAKHHHVALYDLEHRKDVTYAEAKSLLDKLQNPNSFLLENWPDTNEEAEQLLLKEFQKALKQRKVFEASIYELSNHISGGLPIHLGAAQLAADRLVLQSKLELGSKIGDSDMKTYRLPRTVYFSPAFLERLREGLCEECAVLDFDGPFHENCLIRLVDFLKQYDFSLNDMTHVRTNASRTHRRQLERPKLSVEWLSQKASMTTARLKNVLKPIRDGWENTEEEGENADSLADKRKSHTATRLDPTDARDSEVHVETTDGIRTGKPRITKSQLIEYLSDVEILDDVTELEALRDERERLKHRLEERDKDVLQVERAKGKLEKQFQEMQRDMDILIQAMRITKRHDPQATTPHVIDATYENEPL